MPLHVRPHERAHGDWTQPPCADIGDRVGDEPLAQAVVLEPRRHLGVDQHDGVGSRAIEKLSGELAVDDQLVAPFVRIVPDADPRTLDGHRPTLAHAAHMNCGSPAALGALALLHAYVHIVNSAAARPGGDYWVAVRSGLSSARIRSCRSYSQHPPRSPRPRLVHAPQKRRATSRPRQRRHRRPTAPLEHLLSALRDLQHEPQYFPK